MAVTAFLQEEMRTTKIRCRQCEAFLAHKIEGSGVLENPDVREELFKMRKNAAMHKSHVLRLLSLVR